MIDCVFCKKIAEDRAFDGMEVVFFEPLNPVTPGHTLVVPREHVTDFADRPTITARVMETAAQLASIKGGDMNLITSKGHDATQSVFHLHVHLVPRVAGDGLILPWTGQTKHA